jgi:hypothetical protein
MFSLSNKTKVRLLKFDNKYHWQLELIYFIIGIFIIIFYHFPFNFFLGFLICVSLVFIHGSIFQDHNVCIKCGQNIVEIKKIGINKSYNYISVRKCGCGIKEVLITSLVSHVMGYKCELCNNSDELNNILNK